MTRVMIALALAGVLAVAWVTHTTRQDPPPPEPATVQRPPAGTVSSAASSPPSTSTGSPATDPEDVGAADVDEDVEPTPTPRGSAAATTTDHNRADHNRAAAAIARNCLRDYLARTRSPVTWHRQISRWMSPQAREDYRGVDPTQILPATLTGPAVVAPPTEGDSSITIAVPTTRGRYQVLLGHVDGYRVTRIIPPVS